MINRLRRCLGTDIRHGCSGLPRCVRLLLGKLSIEVAPIEGEHAGYLAGFPAAAMHGSDQIADGAMGFKFVTQPCAVQHAVAVAAAFALALDHSAGFKFGEDF